MSKLAVESEPDIVVSELTARDVFSLSNTVRKLFGLWQCLIFWPGYCPTHLHVLSSPSRTLFKGWSGCLVRKKQGRPAFRGLETPNKSCRTVVLWLPIQGLSIRGSWLIWGRDVTPALGLVLYCPECHVVPTVREKVAYTDQCRWLRRGCIIQGDP